MDAVGQRARARLCKVPSSTEHRCVRYDDDDDDNDDDDDDDNDGGNSRRPSHNC